MAKESRQPANEMIILCSFGLKVKVKVSWRSNSCCCQL